MFRIRKYNFHLWFSFPNLSPEIAAKSPQKWLKRRKSPQNRRKKTGSKLTQKDPMKAYILTRGLVPVLTI